MSNARKLAAVKAERARAQVQQLEKSKEEAKLFYQIKEAMIDRIISADSSILNQMRSILRKYIYGAWSIDNETALQKVQSAFLIKALRNLFEPFLKEQFGKDRINHRDIDNHLEKIFSPFLERKFVRKCAESLLINTSKTLMENAEIDELSAARKTHMFGVFNQIYRDGNQVYDFLSINDEERMKHDELKIFFITRNKLTRFNFTTDNFAEACEDGYTANSDTITGILKGPFGLVALLPIGLFIWYGLGSSNVILHFSIIGATLAIPLISVFKDAINWYGAWTDSYETDNEKDLHLSLLNQLISLKILNCLLDDRVEAVNDRQHAQSSISKDKEKEKDKEKDKGKGKDSSKLSDYYRQFKDTSGPYVIKISKRQQRILAKKEEVTDSINDLSQTSLSATQVNVSLTWFKGNLSYTYNSNDLISNIVKLSSDHHYQHAYAKDLYVLFDEDRIWKLVGDKVKFQKLRKAFDKATLVASEGETGFTYRPDPHTGVWTIKLKVNRKDHVGHLSLFYEKFGSVWSKVGEREVKSVFYVPSCLGR